MYFLGKYDSESVSMQAQREIQWRKDRMNKDARQKESSTRRKGGESSARPDRAGPFDRYMWPSAS